jgi:hypothetical protein
MALHPEWEMRNFTIEIEVAARDLIESAHFVIPPRAH